MARMLKNNNNTPRPPPGSAEEKNPNQNSNQNQIASTKLLPKGNSQTTSKMMMIAKSKFLLAACLLVFIISLLSARVLPSQTPTGGKQQISKRTTGAGDESTVAPQQAGGVTSPVPVEQAGEQTSSKKCIYDKRAWGECDQNGSQQKVMRLVRGGPECKAAKTIRRDCRTSGEVGCKYARGEWSSVCQDGLRVRIDTLVGTVGVNEAPGEQQQPRCKPQRRVTKDCRRTCHYTKSAWSECTQGYRTRVLTLAQPGDKSAPGSENELATSIWSEGERTSAGEKNNKAETQERAGPTTKLAAPDNQICVRQKLIRRECRSSPGGKTTAGQAQQQQQQPQQPQQHRESSTTANLTPIQRRRLKQQLKQQQQSSGSTTAASSGAARQSPAGTTSGPSTSATTTTTNKARIGTGGTASGANGNGAKGRATSTTAKSAAEASASSKNRR